MKLTRALCTLALSALLAAPALAQEKKPADPAKPAVQKPSAKKPGGQRQRGARQVAAVNKFFQLPAAVKLTEEQQEQVSALKKEFLPEARELQRKQNALLTDEQKQARRKTVEELRDSDKKGRERQQAIQAALKLTPEQKQQQSELQAAQKALQARVDTKLHALLTDEQKAQLPKRGQRAAARKNAPAKPKNANKPKQPKAAGSET